MVNLVLANNASSTLAGSISSSATTLSIQAEDATKFPAISAGQWHPLTVVDTSGNMEIMRVTGRSGAVLTVQRGKEGTTAKAFAAGSSVQLRFTAGSLLEVLSLFIGTGDPEVTGTVKISGNPPRIRLEDTANAGDGRNWWMVLDNNNLYFRRDINADGDYSDAGETVSIFIMSPTTNSATLNLGLLTDSIRWNNAANIPSSNLNSISTGGFYSGDDLTNSPDGTSAYFFVLHQCNDGNSAAFQIGCRLTSGTELEMWCRCKFSNVWSSWRRITNDNVHKLATGYTSSANKKRIPAFDSSGNFSQSSIEVDTRLGTSLMNASSDSSARSIINIAESDAVAFARVHAGGDTNQRDFSSQTSECAYFLPGSARVSKSGGSPLILQRYGGTGPGITMYYGTNNVGNISFQTDGINFNSVSDWRRKYGVTSLVEFSLSADDAEYLYPNLRETMALRPVGFRWIGTDGPDAPYTYSFIAHELQQVWPSCVTGEKDAVEPIGTAVIPEKTISRTNERRGGDGKIIVETIDETTPAETIEGVTEADAAELGAQWTETGTRPIYQTIDPSKAIAKLTASLQELTLLVLEQRAELKDLKDRLDAYEAA